MSAKSGSSHSLFFKREKRGIDVDTGGKNAFKPLRVIVSELGYDCVGIELATEGKAQFLRVFIDMVGVYPSGTARRYRKPWARFSTNTRTWYRESSSWR